MVRFIHISDLHLGFRQYGSAQRFQDFAKTFNSIIDDAIAEKVEFVLVSGDLFHFRNIDPETYIQALNILTRAKDGGIRVIAIEGNHDFALHRDRISWLRILEEQGVLRLLKLKKNKELELLGDHVDIGDTRIFGVRYIGYSTKKEIESIRKEIDLVNADEGEQPFTILMMHFGMEGVLKRKISGEVSLSALQPLKDVVDYLALGHYHMNYEFDDWIFNGGSPDMVSMDEFGQPKGYYIYNAGNVEFVDTWNRIRPVRRLVVDVTDAKDEVAVLTEIQKKIIASVEKFKEKPLIDILIKGRVQLPRSVFDIGRYQEIAYEKLGALNVNVKLRVEGGDVDVIERELDGLDRRQIEEHVLRKLILGHDSYKENTDQLLPAFLDIKEAVVGQRPEEYGEILHEKLWKLYKELDMDTSTKKHPAELDKTDDEQREPIITEEEPVEDEKDPGSDHGRWF